MRKEATDAPHPLLKPRGSRRYKRDAAFMNERGRRRRWLARSGPDWRTELGRMNQSEHPFVRGQLRAARGVHI